MVKNYRYLLFTTSRKWTTYLFPVLFLTIFSMLIAIKSQSNHTDNSVLWRLGFYYYIVPFACAIIFSALKALNIFKEGEETNVELTLVSKPFKRWQIIGGKFLALYTLFFMYSCITFVWVMLFAFTDSPSTVSEKAKFAGSLAVGSFIIMFLTSSIVVLLSQLLSSVATLLAVGIFVATPIATSWVAPSTHAQHLKFVGTPHYMVNNENIKSAHVKGDQMFFFNPSGIKTSNILDKGLHDRMKKEYALHKKSIYKYLAYVDTYEQLSGFLSMFQDRQWSYESIAKWKESAKVVHSDYKFNIDGWEYIYMYWNDSRFNELTASQVFKISKQASQYVVDHKAETKWSKFLNKDLLERSESKEWSELLSSYIKSDTASFDENTKKLASLIAEKENKVFNKSLTNPAKIQDLMYIKGILADGGTIPVYIPSKYIPKLWVLLGWGILVIVLGFAVGVVYYRKDFK